MAADRIFLTCYLPTQVNKLLEDFKIASILFSN